MRLFLHELRAQQKIFWRSREAAFFTFLLPIIFLVLLILGVTIFRKVSG